MIDLSPEAMQALGVAQAAFTALATMLAVGVAFLSKPSKATLYWVCAFALGMVATFGVVAAGINEAETIRRLCLGALLGAPALLWSGFRAYWGVRPHAWAGPTVSVIAAVVLVAVGDSGAFGTAYRVVYLISASFAVLFFIDWLRFADRRDRVIIPFTVLSLAFGILAVAIAVASLLSPPADGDDLGLIRVTPSVGMLLYIGTAVIAVVGLSTRELLSRRDAASAEGWSRFQAASALRLAEARRSGEPMSMVYLRLDDLTELRQAAGANALSLASQRLTTVVQTVFGSDSTVCSPQTGTVYALVGRPDPGVRDLLRVCLERASQIEIPGRLPVQPSASAGWATTSTVGYDLSALIYLSREAAAFADDKGGDRWERVSATVVERMLTQALRS